MRVVFADDSRIERNSIKALLTQLGHIICGSANSAAAAEALCRVAKPEIVLLDVGGMGEPDSITVAKRLIDDKIVGAVVFATSQPNVLHHDAKRLNAGCLVKPYKLENLRLAIRAALEAA